MPPAEQHEQVDIRTSTNPSKLCLPAHSRICEQTRSESLSIFYGLNISRFSMYSQLRSKVVTDWLSATSTTNCAPIRSSEIHSSLNFHEKSPNCGFTTTPPALLCSSIKFNHEEHRMDVALITMTSGLREASIFFSADHLRRDAELTRKASKAETMQSC